MLVRHTWLGLWVATSTACGLFSDRPYLIEDLTVVAMVAEPPEIHAGETSHLEAWVVDPRAPELPELVWSVCPDRSPRESDRHCERDEILLDASPAVQASGSISVGEAEHLVSTSRVAGLPTIIMEAGFWENVRLLARTRHDEVEAFKRVVVIASEVERNTNPRIDDVAIKTGGEFLSSPYVAEEEDTLVLTPQISSDSRQSYRALTTTGRWESRHEDLVITWHVTGGKLKPWVTETNESTRWQLPEISDLSDAQRTVLIIAVLRDGRGGTAVWFEEIELTE